ARAREVGFRPRAADAEAGAHGSGVVEPVVLARVTLLARRAGRRIGAIPRSVKTPQVRVCFAVLLVVDIKIEEALPCALILHLETRPLRKWHGKPAIQAAPILRAHLQRQRYKVAAQPKTNTEEVAK